MPQNLAGRLRSGARWSGAEIVVNLPLRIATLAILARLLVPAEFGVFAAAVTIIEFARPLSALSIDHAIVQSKKLAPQSIAVASLLALTLSSAVACLIALNARQVLLLYDDPEVPGVLTALAPSLPAAAAASLLLAILRRRLAFRELSIVVMISSALAAVASVGVALVGGGVWALVAGYYLDFVLRIALSWRQVRPRLHRPRFGDEVRGLLRFGMGTSLSHSLNFWALHGDYVVIGSVLGPKPLGYYSRAYQLVSTVPGMLGRVQNMVLFPAFARAQSDREYLGRALRVGTEATAALTLPLCAWGLVLGPELIQTLLGPGWEDAIVPFQILALGVFFRTAYRFASSIIMATGHVFAMSVCQAVYAVLVVLGAIIGSQWGIAGVAAATLAALLVFCLLLYGLAARVSGLSIRSLASAFVRPTLVFLVVLATSALSRSLLVGFGWAPWAIMLSAVCSGLAALIALTVVLRNRLWGDFLYEQVAGFQASRKNDGSF